MDLGDILNQLTELISCTRNSYNINCQTRNSPTKLIVVDPIVVSTGRESIQDTVIASSAVLDRVDVTVVFVNAVRVRM